MKQISKRSAAKTPLPALAVQPLGVSVLASVAGGYPDPTPWVPRRSDA